MATSFVWCCCAKLILRVVWLADWRPIIVCLNILSVLSRSCSLCVRMFGHNLHWFKQFEQHAEGRYFMPFVRLYIYHENDLFSLIPLFRVLPIIKYSLRCCHCLCSVPLAVQLDTLCVWILNLQASLLFDVCFFLSLHLLVEPVCMCVRFFPLSLQTHKYFFATRFILRSFTGCVIAIRFG